MRRTRILLPTCAALLVVLAASIAPVTATSASWGVSSGEWTWKVTKCAWDSFDTTTTWMGRTSTINVTGSGNSSSHAWITGDLSLLEANGTSAGSFTGILLGNVSTDGTDLEVYASATEFILPAIIPLPIAQALDAFVVFLNDTIHDLIASVPAGFPIVIHDDFTFAVSGNTLRVNFTVDVDYQGISLTNQDMVLAIQYDDDGVATRFEGYVANIKYGNFNVLKYTIFEITRTDQLPGLEVPGYPLLVLLLVVPVATALLATRIKRQRA